MYRGWVGGEDGGRRRSFERDGSVAWSSTWGVGARATSKETEAAGTTTVSVFGGAETEQQSEQSTLGDSLWQGADSSLGFSASWQWPCAWAPLDSGTPEAPDAIQRPIKQSPQNDAPSGATKSSSVMAP